MSPTAAIVVSFPEEAPEEVAEEALEEDGGEPLGEGLVCAEAPVHAAAPTSRTVIRARIGRFRFRRTLPRRWPGDDTPGHIRRARPRSDRQSQASDSVG